MTRTRVLRVDLSAGTVAFEPIPAEWRRRYLGGKGLGARYLYEELSPGADPRGPENLLGFMLGPLSGALPGESRYAAVTKSPLTGAFLDSYSGGTFPDRLAGSLADCLGVLVTGAAEEPTALVVGDGDPRLEPAGDLADADTVATAEAYPDAAVACVGPAGESGVAYATIASDAGDHHAGRGGAGAVMGSKNLKAVVARGDPPAVPDALADLHEEYEAAFADDDAGRWQTAGETLESIDFAAEVGVLPANGWRDTAAAVDGIGIEAAAEAADGREHPEDDVPGGFRVETDDGETVPRGAAPMTLGAGLGMDDFDAVAALGEACDRLGVDVITAGNAVAWAVRADEVEFDFGDEDGARGLIERIARRADGDALADALAEGVDAAAERRGGDDLVPTVKSMELPAYDPRGALGMALAYATSDRGGCHRRARPIEEEVFREDWDTARRVAAVVGAQNARAVLWSLVVDDFAGETLWGDLGAEWLDALGVAHDDLARTGERIWTLVRLFNAREGFDRADDELPPRFADPLPEGDAPAAGRAVDPAAFARLLDAYYAAREWDDDGLPTPERCRSLDLPTDVLDGHPEPSRADD
ncbi:aldehyde ferredoxin oxidoreductase [Halobaculum sp. CBA1158]|uniref:aldehyde ferredoxin oxidoreductase family protein n=1 Tax=Halobaculum sp. CBA1158 TaxID=2904243 RepID=UPI001F2AB64E|nr:aldehyde ferredoxin oxidoreductase C-terminal domain-containing protein [Halobaculum sp. CBA1158]UIO99556.1 aldehyde ferredoxin oxidoreductase [Halobaculum sp. CBA1158]